ncbi:hypothetical protein GN956_G21801 [Arapaima gigas]
MRAIFTLLPLRLLTVPCNQNGSFAEESKTISAQVQSILPNTPVICPESPALATEALECLTAAEEAVAIPEAKLFVESGSPLVLESPSPESRATEQPELSTAPKLTCSSEPESAPVSSSVEEAASEPMLPSEISIAVAPEPDSAPVASEPSPAPEPTAAVAEAAAPVATIAPEATAVPKETIVQEPSISAKEDMAPQVEEFAETPVLELVTSTAEENQAEESPRRPDQAQAEIPTVEMVMKEVRATVEEAAVTSTGTPYSTESPPTHMSEVEPNMSVTSDLTGTEEVKAPVTFLELSQDGQSPAPGAKVEGDTGEKVKQEDPQDKGAEETTTEVHAEPSKAQEVPARDIMI